MPFDRSLLEPVKSGFDRDLLEPLPEEQPGIPDTLPTGTTTPPPGAFTIDGSEPAASPEILAARNLANPFSPKGTPSFPSGGGIWEPSIPLPRFPAGTSPITAGASAIANQAIGLAETAESPAGLLATVASLGNPVLARLIGAGFGAKAAHDVPQAAREAGSKSVTGTLQEKADAYAALGVTTALPALIGKSIIPKARPSPMTEAAPRSEVVRPDGFTEAMTPHEELASKMASQIGKEVKLVDDLPEGVIARPGPDNTIHIDRGEFGKWMEGRSPEEAPLLIESLIDEEEIHSHTSNDVGLEYHDAKTTLQRKLALRRYAGKGGPQVSPTNLGKEMLRFDLTRLMGKTPREILEAKGSEWLTVKFITAAERVIDGARKALGTKASKNQARILGEMEQKVGVARQALGMSPADKPGTADTSDEGELAPVTEDAPFAFNKESAQEEIKRISELPDEEMAKYAQATPRFQGEGVKAGLPLSQEDIPALEAARDAMHKKAMGELQRLLSEGKSSSPAMLSTQAKTIWLSGVIEGAKKQGGNYEAVVAQEQPAARRKPAKDERQQEMPLSAGNAAERPERPSAEALGATYEPITPSKVEELAAKQFAGRPSFASFAQEAKERFGNVQAGQLKEAWRDHVWKRLMAAPGSAIAKLRDQLGLKEALGGGELADPVEERFTLQQEGTAAGRRSIREDAAAIRARQNRRKEAITRIGEKLIKQSESERPALRRASVTPEDIGWWRETGGVEPPFVEFRAQENISPEKLTSGGTVDTARKLPASATTRIVVLRDNLSGKTELVSAYKDHGKHYMVDPGNPGAARPHVLINELLQRKLPNRKPRYTPIASLLLDDPVQGFHQRLDGPAWKQFADAAGNELQRRKESAVEAAALPQPETEEARPAIRTGTAITNVEAGAILDHIYDEVGHLDSPADMRDALTALQERANTGTLKGRDWQVISGLEKAVETIQKQFRNVGPNEAYEKALDQIYGHATQAENREAFIQRMLGKPAADLAPGIPEGTPPAATGTAGARDLTMLDRRPPTAVAGATRKGPGPKPFLAGEKEPAAYRKGADLGAEFTKAGSGIRALWRRGPVNVNIAAHLDSFVNRGNNTARKAGNSIRLQSADPKARTSLERGAAIRVLEARGDKEALLGFASSVGVALQRARALAANGRNILQRYEGRKWEKSALRMQEEIQYAYDNWQKRSLRQTAAKGKAVLDEVYEFDKNRGVKLDYRGGYIPGRYEGEVFNDNILTFGDQQLILGRNWRKAKVFSNYAEAMKEGYLPANSDLADLAEHRVRQSWREGGKDLWLNSLKEWNDPDSGEAIVQELAKEEIPRPMKKVTDESGQVTMEESPPKVEWGTPSPDYVKFSLGPGRDVVAVRRGYERLLQTLTMQGHISMHPVGDAALHFTGALKHGVILILDTFHPGRLGQYAVGISNKPGYRKGFHVLEYAESDMEQAVAKGLIPQSSVDWARGTIDVRLPGKRTDLPGASVNRTEPMTRRAVVDLAERLGLNTGRIQDALYKESVRRWPVIGALNRFTFDRLTRGLMAEGAVSEFERLNKAFPALDRNEVMTKVVRDINRYYGNLGNQGVFRNPTIKEINQLLLLAPQWVEGLLQKEIRGAARAVTGPYDMARNQFVEDAQKRIPYGTIGRGMGRGLAAYFALTQVINLITRRQTTFQNPEHDHKLDAWIPGGKEGFFISPLSVFAEVAHDILRYAEQKPMLNEAMTQIGYNKLGPWGRLAVVLGTERNGQGEKLTSTPSVYKEAVAQVVPFVGASPISVGKLAREAGHAIAPSLVAPNQPGAVQRQLMSSAGVKVEPAKAAPASITDKARRFAEQQGWKKRNLPELTEDASYNKVRQAIRIGDEKGAMKVIAELRQNASDAQIEKAMRQHVSRPFTGSKEHEREFMDSLNASDASLYDAARDEERQELEKFFELWAKRP